ncbi:MAG: HyaD/HybD family hydrogenase maturation endopeptidase [Chloroflexales bacterium]
MNRSVVLGLGNMLNRDEGLGVHAVRAMAARLGPAAGVELVDGGTIGLGLLNMVEACEHLLILDAADGRREPGTLIELRGEQIPLYAGVKLSQHQITFQEVLGLAKMRGRLPPYLHLIGVQPADMAIGLELSPTVAATLPAVLGRARILLTGWGLLTPCDWNE